MIANSRLKRALPGAALLLATATALPAAAQDPMITDRPDFTESTATVAPGVFQLEAGYTFSRFGSLDGHRVGEALLRTGVIPGLEARVGLPSYQTASAERPGDDLDENGFGDANLGIKLGLHDSPIGEGMPSVALLLGTGVPTGNDFFGAGGWEPEAKLALAWGLTPRIGLGANVNYAQRAGATDRYDEWGASVALGFPLTDRLSGFGEYFAIRPDLPGEAGERDYIDGGVTWLMTPNLQLDGRIGVGIGSPVDDDFFFGVGLSTRL